MLSYRLRVSVSNCRRMMLCCHAELFAQMCCMMTDYEAIYHCSIEDFELCRCSPTGAYDLPALHPV